MKDKQTIIIVALIIVVMFGGGYAVGVTTKKTPEKLVATTPKLATSSTTNKIIKESTTNSSFRDVEETPDTSKSMESSRKEKDDSSKKAERNLPEELLPYRDDQIEYARIWLGVMGENFFKNRGGLEGFNLNVSKFDKGTPVSPYGKGSIDWPFDVIVLTGGMSADGMICYTSNHDGTINRYDVPSHWHQPEEQLNDPEYMKNLTGDIVNKPSVVSVPEGEPNFVREMIRLEKINL